MKKIVALILAVATCVGLLVGCGTAGSNKDNTRTITDGSGRQVEVPEKVEWAVDWTKLYGELPAGEYRIAKEIMNFRGGGDFDTKTFYAEFTIE